MSTTAPLTNPPLPLAIETDRPGTARLTGLPGRFLLHYQPQLDLRSGAIARCEALLRWRHPRFGVLHPHATLCGTRWSDDLTDLEEWAVAEVARQGAAWESAGPPVQIAVNVSGSFLLGPRFAPAVDHALDATGVAPGRLAIDVPFGALATDPAGIERVAGVLAAANIAMIVDGVAGDAHPPVLDRVDAEAWKIDLAGERRGPSPLHASVERSVGLAHQAGALAIAKAVEDDRRLAEVRSLGFDGVFGHVVSPALPPEGAHQVLRPASRPMRPLFGPKHADRGPQAVRNR